MQQFKTKPKKWGNSLGITIPSDIVQKEHLGPDKDILVLIMEPDPSEVKAIFGTLKLKKPTQQIMDEIDEGYDE